MGSDPRIGYHFLYPGVGYGGSCFPKDVKALVQTAKENGHTLRVLTAVEEANEVQKLRLVEKVVSRFGEDLSGRRFALWGLAFKPNTDDMREAPSRVIVEELTRRGAEIVAFDPVAAHEAQRVMTGVNGIAFADDMMKALQDADALLIVTEWKMFRAPDFEAVRRSLKQPLIFDGRNMYDPAWLREQGFDYHAIGR
ncbi:UDP-glucose 6-dehydrogenase tuaD [Chromobacterium violaceum]|nr:UDP-glucose 6-dehydrogenase tuaD [Chromobacterium violaceum]